MSEQPDIVAELKAMFGDAEINAQTTRDGMPTIWVSGPKLRDVLRYLKQETPRPYKTLHDLTAVDERERAHKAGLPPSDFTMVYHLVSYDRNEDIRVKVPLSGEHPSVPTVTDIWKSANWYEREAWDMFGVNVEGHPHMRRILMPLWWKGHPLRKDHPARATEMGVFTLPEEVAEARDEQNEFRPDEWGWERAGEDFDYMVLNFGPQHPGAHGVIRMVCQLDGQEVVDVSTEIGFHHRGAEKMGERQSWHTYIPYTDRIDYLGGLMNEVPYVQAVETLAGIQVPDRAKVIRIMMAELFRVISHLVYYGTLAQDVGALSPVFFMFSDRERAFDIVEAIAGGRMHPMWFRIGGVAQNLPKGWDTMVADFLKYMPRRLREYDKLVLKNSIFKKRTMGVGDFTIAEGQEWGATGPMLRATGIDWDLRKKRPYGGYDQFEFDVPTGKCGDIFDRAWVHVEEIRQSLRIIEQCLKNMPAGSYKADHPQATPPRKERTMHDIETLIDHFVHVSWGPAIPAGEASCTAETTKGQTTYYLTSDGSTMSYRTRIRTPSFAHIQMLPVLSRGLTVADLAAIIGSIDYVLADIDR